MLTQEIKNVNQEIQNVLKELQENPFRTFNLVFICIIMIPLATIIYLLSTKQFSADMFKGNLVVVILIGVALSFAAYCVGYSIIRKTLAKVIACALLAKRKDQLKSSIMSSVTHDLGNPLTIMRMSLSNMMDGLNGEINDDQKRALSVCYGITERMSNMTKTLLDTFKMEAGGFALEKSQFDLNEIVKKQAEEFKELCKEKELNLTVSTYNEPLNVWADKDKIQRVINNLLSNCVKYTKKGGDISIETSKQGKHLKMVISDTGVGIEPNKIHTIFDKFKQLDANTSGAGLGLAIVKDIIKVHKGNISVYSEVDEGTKFTIELPEDPRETR